MVINYKQLNEKTKFDGYFLPNKDLLVNAIQGCNYFTKFDCKSGFFQIKLTDESKELTAFSTPLGHYQWNVLPMGLKNAPQKYQRRMDKCFEPYREFCIVYVDDILIFSKTFEDHEGHINKVITSCIDHGIILSKKKAEICKNSINFLGLIINKGKIELQEHILHKLHNFPNNIQNKKQLQQLLGILTYTDSFIKNLAELRKPLQQKLSTKIPWTWDQKDSQYVQYIKTKLQHLPTLIMPLEGDSMILETDASENIWSAILKCVKDGKEVICKYTSGTFKNAEKNYHINEKKLLAVKNGIKKFEIYLIPKKFLVRSDNKQIKAFLKNNLELTVGNKRLIRLQTWFANFDFDIEFIKGKDNILPDLLTRDWSDMQDNGAN